MNQGLKEYLTASGAVAISSIGGVEIETQWIARKYERKVVRTASRLAGENPDSIQASVALRDAAALHAVSLTSDSVAIERARHANMMLDSVLQNGLLRTFNAEYARRRRAGKTKLTFPAAKLRFRRALIRRLGNGLPSSGLIDEVFK